MTSVYLLRHLEEKRENILLDFKTVGTYSSADKAREAIVRYRDLPGFRDYPERWRIDEVTLDRDDWAEGFDKETHRRIG